LNPPKAESPAPFLNFAPLQNSLVRLQESIRAYEALARESAGGTRLKSPDAQKALDDALRRIEPALTNERGLPGRPWFKHQIYAPGLYTGYGVKTLPGIREAIEQHKWNEATEQIGLVAATLDRAAEQIDMAGRVLKGDR
jgi:N-acetylated-alpha-linked acidic dipeptidase